MQFGKTMATVLCACLLQACVAVEPEQAQNEKASAVNVQLGIGYLQQNKLELADEKLSKALRQDPESASAHNAYAILQERLRQIDKAEYHYRKATEIDPKDSQAANNYGTFLCRNGREVESEEYFIKALDNPLYSTPEYAYTNAAVCLLRVRQVDKAQEYLRRALTEKSDFSPALLAMAGLYFDEDNYDETQVYLDRFHVSSQPTARSLWLSIRTALAIDPNTDVSELVQRLGELYPDSREYQLWKGLE